MNAHTIQLIPKPKYGKLFGGQWSFAENSALYCAPEFHKVIRFFSDMLPFKLSRTEQPQDADICFIKDSALGDEAYRLHCDSSGLNVFAGTPSGAFYAIQSLRQLLGCGVQQKAPLTMDCMTIEDAPALSWRGLSLDVSRHFFEVDDVKWLLDMMAMHKLNRFHWHLTDDQGWRIEIKKYPLLTEIGSKRCDTNIHGWQSTDREGRPHSGFYTQDQIREIVEYAAERMITVVPEIDMPAHFAAAMASYNWLTCRDIPCEVPWYFGGTYPESMGITDWNRIACAGKETTYQFIFDVLEEIIPLFPSKLFHIGGDEAPKAEWEKCPHCQKVIRDNHLKNEAELQAFFTNKIKNWLADRGVKLIGWNELLAADNIGRDTIAQYWTPGFDKNVLKHLQEGGKVILSCHSAFYFDMCYAQVPLQSTYNFSPADYHIPPSLFPNILGVEAELWTEWIGTRQKLEITAFPRLEALSENAWTPAGARSFDDFLDRLRYFEKILEAIGVRYASDKVALEKTPEEKKAQIQAWYAGDTDIDVRNSLS